MQTLSQKIIVKVGKKSNTKFRGAKTFRAITVDELNTLYKLHPDASIVVIENIKATDYDKIKQFIIEFEAANENNRVFFNLSPDDDITSGIADELDKDIYLNLQDLQDVIGRIYKISVSTNMDKIAATAKDIDMDDEDPFDSSFDDSISTIQETQKQRDEQILPSIESKDDIEVFDTSILDREDAIIGGAQAETIGSATSNIGEVEGIGDVNSAGTKTGTEDVKGAESTKGTDAVATVDKNSYTSSSAIELEKDSNKTPSNPDMGDMGANELLNKLRQDLDTSEKKLRDSTNEVEDLKKQLKNAIDKYSNLQDVVKAVNSEKDILQDRLKQFTTSEVMEEPITLEQYRSLQENIKKLSQQSGDATQLSIKLEEANSRLKELEEKEQTTGRSVDEYKRRLQESGSKLVEAHKTIGMHEETIAKLQAEIEEAKRTENLSQETMVKLDELNSANASLSSQVNELRDTIAQLTADKEKLEGKLVAEARARELLFTIIYDSVAEIQNMSSVSTSTQDTIDSLKQSLSALEILNTQNSARIAEYEQKMITFSGIELSLKAVQEERDRLIAENDTSKLKIQEYEARVQSFSTLETTNRALMAEKDRIAAESQTRLNQITALQGQILTKDSKIQELETATSTIDARLEMARNFSKNETDKARQETAEVKTKLSILQSQYDEKNAQYEQLVKASGMNENGVSSLLETSKTLEAYNKTLIDQVATLQKKLSDAESEAAISKQTAEVLESSNRSMRANMESMSSLIGDNSKGQSIKPLRYTNRGMIIPVFGCGSFGITTTAMSIANKLSAQSRVLYIDFDMVSPKADGWFRINPVIKNIPGADTLGRKCTGLGLFVEKQIQFFMNNYQQIISKPIQTKNGCIDYISGFYVRPDTNKLLVADFSALLNFLGNIYTYIIIDFGKLGCSEVSDQLIKVFVEASYKSVVVTTSDKFETNSFRMKLAECKINTQKLAWLLNMCITTKLEDATKRAISPIGYEMIPLNTGIYGKKMNFMNDSLTRDKMTKFMEEKILGR